MINQSDSGVGVPAVQSQIIGDPAPIALGLFALALAALGTRFVDVTAASLAASPTNEFFNYAILAAGIAEGISGFLCVMRGGHSTFIGWVTGTFGIWLVMLFFMLTHTDPSAALVVPHALSGAERAEAIGAATAAFHSESSAWYVFFLIIPVGIYTIVACTTKNAVLIIAFIAIEIMLFLLGLGLHDVYVQLIGTATAGTPPHFGGAIGLLRVMSYLAFISAACLWWIQGKEVFAASFHKAH